MPVSASVLSAMIERTMYAASVDETRYNLNGVYLEVLGDRRATSASSRPMAIDSPASTARSKRMRGAPASGVIVPRKGLGELKRLVDEDDAEEIELAFANNSGLARKGDVTLVMRLIEGEFPNYNQVIPRDLSRHLLLPTDTLTQAVRRVALLSSERNRAVKLELRRASS
ncbi:MAG: hypothetical protein R3E53_06660 [Myxococcota bacterium]